MTAQTLASAAPSGTIPKAHGEFFHVLMLQIHVATSALWAVCVVVAALMAVPKLRRIPSAVGLHVLQVNRQLLVRALWGAYLLSFATGTWLMYKQAIYDPPFSGSDWSKLRHEPYGVPYYYALYAKIALFLLMGAASYVLAREAGRASTASEVEGGPVEFGLDAADTASWLDEEVLPEGTSDELGVSGPALGTTSGSRTAARTSLRTGSQTMIARAMPRSTASPAVLWGALIVVAAGFGGIGFCVTLIKYFHELSKSAAVYQILLRG